MLSYGKIANMWHIVNIRHYLLLNIGGYHESIQPDVDQDDMTNHNYIRERFIFSSPPLLHSFVCNFFASFRLLYDL